MYPRPLAYERPEHVEDAIETLADGELDSRAIAGGQSLVPMLSMGLAQPERLVDIGRLELGGFERANGTVTLGGLTRHRELERSAELRELLPLASEAASYVGNPRVRNRGTLGGSLAHADPASELGAVALAHGGEVVIRGAGGERRVAISAFFRGLFETAVEPGELLLAVELELPPDGAGHGFFEVANRADDFATAAAAALLVPSADGRTCTEARIALAGVGEAPLRVAEAERLCAGAEIDLQLLDRIAATLAGAISPEDDPFVSAAHRRRVAAACAARAVGEAWSRAGEGRS